MTRPTPKCSGGAAGNGDDGSTLLRIDAEVFESLSVRGRADADGDAPLILRWFDAWASSGE